MQSTSLSAWLTWLEENHPREIDLGLDRITAVARRMSLLNPSATVVTVAGTNGKGSCVASTTALLRAAGHSVGVYTSPHLLRYNERIVIDGEPVSDSEICAAFNAIFVACQLPDAFSAIPISLTYFEYGTLAAFEIFRMRGVTAIVLEVGLGGRLDAVNIIDADVAVITSISIDHTDWLGNDRETIGYEKAGIMRAGKPVVCADPAPPASIAEHATRLGAKLYQVGRDFDFRADSDGWDWWNSHERFEGQPLPHLPLPSVAAALQVATLLSLPLTGIEAFSCVAQLRVPGRFQRLSWQDREVVLDVAHNPAATAYLVSRLQASELATRPIHAVVAMMSDKDRISSLGNLAGRVTDWYLADLSSVPRAAKLEEMRETLRTLNCIASREGSLNDCLNAALEASQPGDVILIFGSFYTVAAGLEALDISR